MAPLGVGCFILSKHKLVTKYRKFVEEFSKCVTKRPKMTQTFERRNTCHLSHPIYSEHKILNRILEIALYREKHVIYRYYRSGLWNCCNDRECLIGMPDVAAIISFTNDSELCIVVPPRIHR